MPIDAVAHFVFVDFENVPNVDLGLVTAQAAHVTLLIGKNQKNLGLGLVQQIHRQPDKVALVEVGASGHNALDLTLSYHLGQAVLRSPEARFYIVSKDKDFDPLISHLEVQEVKVVRVTSFDALPFLPRSRKSAVPSSKPVVDKRAKLIARLRNPDNHARPSTGKALLARIKTDLGKESTDAKVTETFRELIDKNVLTIDAKDIVSYVPPPRGKTAS